MTSVDPHPADGAGSTPVPVPVMARYHVRDSRGGAEEIFRLSADRLQMEGGGAGSRALSLDQVRAVHLKHVRGRSYRYYQCIVRTDGDELVVGYVPRRGDDGGDAYAAFVRQLLAALATRPHVRFSAGSMASYAYLAAAMAVLGWFVLNAEPWLAALGLAAALFVGATLLWPSRPRRFDPADPPASLLPR